MSAKWVGNGPVTNTGGGTGELKREQLGGAGQRGRVLLMKKQMQIVVILFCKG